jgi:glycosyltransferase involved in cell wall biosynthesis
MIPSRPDVCLVCPFDLGRPSGTPFRAVATTEALSGRLTFHVLATSDAHGAEALGNVWSRHAKLSPPRFALAAYRRLRELRPRVIHCVTPVAAVPALAVRALNRRTRVVLEYHGPAEYELASARARARAFFTLLDRWVAREVDAILAMSTPQETYLRRRCGATAPIEVSWGPVDLGRTAWPPPVPGATRRFGYFGNANFWQGLDHLVEAARLCSGESLRLVVAGVDASELPTNSIGPRLEVRGRLDRAALLAAMEACDVLVSPRRGGKVTQFQYPLKLSAYLAAARPVIGTDVNDQGIIIRRAGCGAVVPPDSPEALADTMREFVRLPARHISDLGARARAFAEAHLGYDTLRSQLGRLYRVPVP